MIAIDHPINNEPCLNFTCLFCYKVELELLYVGVLIDTGIMILSLPIIAFMLVYAGTSARALKKQRL